MDERIRINGNHSKPYISWLTGSKDVGIIRSNNFLRTKENRESSHVEVTLSRW